jgi:hypothetical protein
VQLFPCPVFLHLFPVQTCKKKNSSGYIIHSNATSRFQLLKAAFRIQIRDPVLLVF